MKWIKCSEQLPKKNDLDNFTLKEKDLINQYGLLHVFRCLICSKLMHEEKMGVQLLHSSKKTVSICGDCFYEFALRGIYEYMKHKKSWDVTEKDISDSEFKTGFIFKRDKKRQDEMD